MLPVDYRPSYEFAGETYRLLQGQAGDIQLSGTAQSANEQQLPTIDLLGFPFHQLTERECVAHIIRELASGRGGWVVTPNLDILRMLSESPELWTWFRRADLIVADGMPVIWASRIIGTPLPERVAGSSLVSTLTAGAAAAQRSIFLLGGNEGAADGAAAELMSRHPELQVAGILCPPMGFDQDPIALERVMDQVAGAKPDIVYVALGCPKQEHLIEQLRRVAPNAWFLGIGISFSYLSGEVSRAPAWMRRSGLEWGFRLAQEPGRLARRYLRHGLPFALRLFSLSLRTRLRGRRADGAQGPSLRPRGLRGVARQPSRRGR